MSRNRSGDRRPGRPEAAMSARGRHGASSGMPCGPSHGPPRAATRLARVATNGTGGSRRGDGSPQWASGGVGASRRAEGLRRKDGRRDAQRRTRRNRTAPAAWRHAARPPARRG